MFGIWRCVNQRAGEKQAICLVWLLRQLVTIISKSVTQHPACDPCHGLVTVMTSHNRPNHLSWSPCHFFMYPRPGFPFLMVLLQAYSSSRNWLAALPGPKESAWDVNRTWFGLPYGLKQKKNQVLHKKQPHTPEGNANPSGASDVLSMELQACSTMHSVTSPYH